MSPEKNAHEGDEAPDSASKNRTSELAHTPIDVSKLGLFENDVFYLKRGDHKKVFTYFKAFFVHRVQYVGTQKKMSKNYVDPASIL